MIKFFVKHKNIITNITGGISGFNILLLGYIAAYAPETNPTAKLALCVITAVAVTLSQYLTGKRPEENNGNA